MSETKILDWKPHRSGPLRGFVKIEFPSVIIFRDVSIFEGQDGPYATPPTRPRTDRQTANVVVGSDGKWRYDLVIEFRDKHTRSAWADAVIGALRAAHPEAFADDAGG